MDITPLCNRILKNHKRLKNYLKLNNIGAYRIYDRDIPEYPLTIEFFKDYKTSKNYCVIWPIWEEIDNASKKELVENELPQFLKINFQIDEYWIKHRKIQRTIKHEQYERRGNDSIILTIQEGIHFFKLNLSDYLDVGLFLDHRPLRMGLFNHSPKKVLNLFSYTCSLGVAYAKRDSIVTNVDLSKKYLEWGKENFALNKLKGKHSFIDEDIREFLKTNRERFDLIIIDAPTFSNSKDLPDFDVKRDHFELIALSYKKLTENGQLIFSCNLKGLKPKTDYPFKDFTDKSIPPDFAHKPHILYLLTQESPSLS